MDLILRATPYQFIDGVLFRRNYDGVFLRCLEKAEVDNNLLELHAVPAGGHYPRDTTSHKILRVCHYFPTLFKYAYSFSIKCEAYQRCAGKAKKYDFPLQPVTVKFPF